MEDSIFTFLLFGSAWKKAEFCINATSAHTHTIYVKKKMYRNVLWQEIAQRGISIRVNNLIIVQH